MRIFPRIFVSRSRLALAARFRLYLFHGDYKSSLRREWEDDFVLRAIVPATCQGGGLETAAPCSTLPLRFRRENQRGRPGRFQLANFFEPGVFEPVFDFVKTESVAVLRV